MRTQLLYYTFCFFGSHYSILVEEAYTAAMFSMARLNKTAAKLMHTHGLLLHAINYILNVILHLQVLMELLTSQALGYWDMQET